MGKYLIQQYEKKDKIWKKTTPNLKPLQMLGFCIVKKSTWTTIKNELELKQSRIENLRNRLNQLYYN